MPYVSKEQIEKARGMDLLTYLQTYEPTELVSCGGQTYRTRSHDSLKISNGKWCWWSQGIGGTNALDYLTKVRGMNLPDAVLTITGAAPPQVSFPQKAPERIPFELPPRHANNRRVFSYLTGRGIHPHIINYCIREQLLYEDAAHHNCIFVGYEKGKPSYAACRGTLSDFRFVGEISGSDKRFSFAVQSPSGGETLCVFESAIDALSYLSLLKLKGADWQKANCLSLAGVYQPKGGGQIAFPAALEQYLKDHPGIRRIVLCLDNDAVGRAASKAIMKKLDGYEVIDLPPKQGKDYNDLLQIKTGRQRSKEQRYAEAR